LMSINNHHPRQAADCRQESAPSAGRTGLGSDHGLNNATNP
jgi:hypothetical protein